MPCGQGSKSNSATAFALVSRGPFQRSSRRAAHAERPAKRRSSAPASFAKPLSDALDRIRSTSSRSHPTGSLREPDLVPSALKLGNDGEEDPVRAVVLIAVVAVAAMV